MKRLLLLTVFLPLSFLAAGQTPLTSNDILSTIGTNFRQYLVALQDTGVGGMNQTWDYSGMLSSDNVHIEISENGSDDPDAVYPEANHIWSLNFDEDFIYSAITPTAYSYYGQFSGDDFQLFYSDPQTVLPFPASYEMAFVDTFAANYSAAGSPGAIEGNLSGTVNGYGTLMLPWGTLESVYRVTTHTSQTEEFLLQEDTVQAFYTGTNVSWFAPGFTTPIMSINQGVITIPSLSFEQEQNSTTYLGDFDFLGVDDHEIVSDLKIFPNPASDILNISFKKETAESMDIELLDVRGRKLKSEANFGAGTGLLYHSIDVSDLPSGFYLLRLTSERGIQSRKVVVK